MILVFLIFSGVKSTSRGYRIARDTPIAGEVVRRNERHNRFPGDSAMKKQTKAEAVAYTELAKVAAKLRQLIARRKKQSKQAAKGGQSHD